jgi:hypothetical protein
MTDPHDDRDLLRPDDVAFVERLTREFSPDPMGNPQRAAFDDALADRMVRRPSIGFGIPVLAGAVLAALVAWLLLPTAFEAPAPVATLAEMHSAAEWEDELLDVLSFGEVEESDGGDELPDDYATIAAVFLDG